MTELSESDVYLCQVEIHVNNERLPVKPLADSHRKIIINLFDESYQCLCSNINLNPRNMNENRISASLESVLKRNLRKVCCC